jgi:hypothetical protein
MSSVPIRFEPALAMRRVLLIAFGVPPVQTVGSVKPAALAKYLPQFGWGSHGPDSQAAGNSKVIEVDCRNRVPGCLGRLEGQVSSRSQARSARGTRPSPGQETRDVPVHTRPLDSAKYILSYPDSTKGLTPFVLAAVQEIRRQNVDFDAIVTTSPPISSHLIGREAKNILGCP